MSSPQKDISLVIHTPARARRLKEVLESHGISASLEEVDANGDEKIKTDARKVMINIDDLPMALKILESGDLVSSPLPLPRMENSGNTLLIPIDFSPASMLAVKVGFYLAKKLELEPVLMHAFLAPQFTPTDFYENQVDPVGEPDIIEAEEEIDLRNSASSQLSKFKRSVEKAIADGKIDDVKFSTTLLEGVAEQVIHEYCRMNNPFMIVMATRGVDKKESDLVGSVTAEVIDACRVPILTIPDNYVPHGVEGIKNIAMFCTLTGFDAVTVRGLMRMFNYPQCNIWLLPVSENQSGSVNSKLENLRSYLADTFPTATIHEDHLPKGKFDDNMRKLLDEKKINLIIVPNKKSNAISRFFRPTIAHKILFERDIPLLVLPV